MPEKIKIRRIADFRDRGQIVNVQHQFLIKMANYNVQPVDSDCLIMSAHINSDHVPVTFTLPQVATANGRIFEFYNMNVGAMHIVAELWNSATIVAGTNQTANSVAYSTVNANIAASCKFICDGISWFHQHLGPHLEVSNTGHVAYTVT